MSVLTFSFLFLCLSTCFATFYANALLDVPTPYLSPKTFFPNYQKMLETLKIFIYKPNTAFAYSSQAESLFYASLRNSPFATADAEQAHLFFVPFPSDISLNSISRVVRGLRREFPYWNRTLGADHVYLSCAGGTADSDRNVLELRKNSIQISCFPTPAGNFIPHKDITLPPVGALADAPPSATVKFLGYFSYGGGGEGESTLVEELKSDPGFLVESGPSDEITFAERASSSKFCLFEYKADVSRIGGALGLGCVPVVITDRPIQDLPFMDVLRWQEIAVFVGSGGGVEEIKHVLSRTSGEEYERLRGIGVTASKHFVWHESPEPFDCFNTLMFQLWLRRHTIRYVLRD
ncbi:Exostosin-like [Parasponia andersonii]|uniref:Exostosin-like n=1 Tax=Parasponia andersonii TaxID=3476 RepID=A0A2P5ALE4_PARAD|nr:Exostosin-like [Parasponia andersonii]